MADHDALCPQRHQYRGHKSRCVCALLAAARADEREQVGRVWAKREDLLLGDIEVARADERENGCPAMGCPVRAARAEAASFSAEIDRMVRELSAIRMEHEAEVAALREEVAHAWAVANGEARR